MAKVGFKAKRGLLSAHIVFTSIFLGGVLCMLLLTVGNNAAELKDVFMLIDNTSGFATIVTGFFLCGLTDWGFFKYYWVIVKTVLFLAIAILGARVQGPWINDLVVLSGQAMSSQYLSLKNTITLYFSFEILVVISLVVISVFKPWGKTKTYQKG